MLEFRRPYAPMTKEDLRTIQDAKKRVKALEFIISRSKHFKTQTIADLAMIEIAEIKNKIYQQYDIML